MKRPRVNLGNWLILLGLLTAVSASFSYLNLDLAALLQGDSPAQMARFAAGFLPPDLSAPLLRPMFITRVGVPAPMRINLLAIYNQLG